MKKNKKIEGWKNLIVNFVSGIFGFIISSFIIRFSKLNNGFWFIFFGIVFYLVIYYRFKKSIEKAIWGKK